MGRIMCRVVPLRVGFLRVGFLRVGFRVGFFSRLGVAAAPVAGVLSVFFPGVSEISRLFLSPGRVPFRVRKSVELSLIVVGNFLLSKTGRRRFFVVGASPSRSSLKGRGEGKEPPVSFRPGKSFAILGSNRERCFQWDESRESESRAP